MDSRQLQGRARNLSDVWLTDAVPPEVDVTRLRLARLKRVRAELEKRDCAACVLIDPVNIRYATDARNMKVFMEVAEKAWPIPDEFVENRYFVLAHGVGMTGEYPYILHQHDFDDAGYDGRIEENMTLCVESYIGAEHGIEGVKLEEQILITKQDAELLSHFPFEADLLGRTI